MNELRLYMMMLGCTPAGRLTEQHDIFFGIGESLKELIPHIIASWPEAKGKVHIDAWREVKTVGEYRLSVKRKSEASLEHNRTTRLFFLNLGGYKRNEFDEFHYKLLIAGENKSAAIKQAKTSAFYLHNGFKGAASHIDEKYGVDVDDVHEIAEILPAVFKEQYALELVKTQAADEEDEIHLGYLPLGKIK